MSSRWHQSWSVHCLFFNITFLSHLKWVSKNCIRAWAWSSGDAYVLIWCQQGDSHYTFIEPPIPPHDKERYSALNWKPVVKCPHYLHSWLCLSSVFYFIEWKFRWLYLVLLNKIHLFWLPLCVFLMKMLALVKLPIMLCSPHSNLHCSRADLML